MDQVERYHHSWRTAAAVLFLIVISYSLGVFFFDRELIVLKKIQPEGSRVFTNGFDLGPCLKYSAFALVGLAGLALLGGKVWAGRKGRRLGEGFARQAWTLAPCLALMFGRYADGKAVKYVVFIPLYPLLVTVVVLAVLYLNAALHLNVNLRPALRGSRKKTIVWTIGLASLLVHLLTLSPFFRRYSGNMIFLGDEPKYLRMAYSLASEGDLDLTDDFVGDDIWVYDLLLKARASGERPIGDYSVLGRKGGIYHFHMPGISSLILPSFLLDLRTYPRPIPNTRPIMFLPAKMVITRAWLIVIALGFFLLAARFYLRIFRSLILMTVLLLALLGATKVPEFMLQIYPETAAGLCLFLGLNALFFPFAKTWLNRIALIGGIGFLPWLHQRFIPLALSLYVLHLVQALRSKRGRKDALWIGLGLAVIGLGYASYFYAITGNPMPWSLYRLWGTSYTRAAIFPSGFFGYLFDTTSGLLSQFPVFLFALTGMYWGAKHDRGPTGKLLAVVLPYFCLICITPWHGIAWETTRMSLVLFPLFLVFVGYTIRSLFTDTSWPHLVFYSAGLAFLLWNRAHHFWEISLGNVLILPHQVGYIIQSAAVLILFGLAFWGLDLWTKKKRLALPLDRIRLYLRECSRRLKGAAFWPRVGKGLAGLGLAIPLLYGFVFTNNWADKTMTSSYFGGIVKISRRPEARLHRKDRPSIGQRRTDKEFIDIFRWDVPFELRPGRRRQSLPLGTRTLSEKCPAGCYRVELEFQEAPPEFTQMSLDFMGETRNIEITSQPGTTRLAAAYLVFQDRFVSPEIVLRYPTPLSQTVKGRMTIFPMPCLVFGKRLIVQLGDNLSPEAITASGSGIYLTFTASTAEVPSTYRLYLSPLESGGGGEKSGAPLALLPLEFQAENERYVRIKLEASAGTWPEGAFLSLSASDALGRPLEGRSAMLPLRDGAGLIPSGLGPTSPPESKRP